MRLAAALTLALALLAGGAAAQTTRQFDAQGRMTGRSDGTGDVRHFDASGRLTGRSRTTGNTARLRDAQGRSTGRIERNGDTWRRYDAQGRLVARGTGPAPNR